MLMIRIVYNDKVGKYETHESGQDTIDKEGGKKMKVFLYFLEHTSLRKWKSRMYVNSI